jgi:hypothetical protein
MAGGARHPGCHRAARELQNPVGLQNSPCRHRNIIERMLRRFKPSGHYAGPMHHNILHRDAGNVMGTISIVAAGIWWLSVRILNLPEDAQARINL